MSGPRLRLILVLAIAGSTPVPDVVLPGQRRIANELLFEDGPAFSEWQLVAAPTRGLHGVQPVVPGRALPFSGKYGTRLYALPRTLAIAEHAEPATLAQWPSALPPVPAVWSVSAARPLANVVTTCRFSGVRDGRVEVVALRQEHLDAQGRPTGEQAMRFLLLGVAAAGALGLWRIARRSPQEGGARC